MTLISRVVLAAALLSPAPALAQDAEARSALDRTAVWVADPLTYTVRIVCAPGIDVLEDDLAPDKLKLDGLEFVRLETLRDAGPGDMTIRTFHYHLTTYKVDQRALKIGDMTARYYRVRPGQGIENGEPAGEVKVPGALVAFRSTLPDDQEAYLLRDGRTSARRRQLFANARPIGTGLLVASIVPVAFWAAVLVRERRPRAVRRSVGRVRHDERISLEAVRAIDVGDVEGRRDAYTQINALVRDHLRDVLGIPGPSLTPSEIEPALSSRAGRVPVGAIKGLLADCETARYALPEALPSAEACRAAIDEAARVLAIR